MAVAEVRMMNRLGYLIFGGLFAVGVICVVSPFLFDGGVCFFLIAPTDPRDPPAIGNFIESSASVLLGIGLIVASGIGFIATVFYGLGAQFARKKSQ